MTSFTVIVPNLNTPTVGQTVQALRGQTLEPDQYRVIVVGLDRFGVIQEDERVRFDRSERPLAPARARNRGAAQAQGEVLAFTDADCLPHPDWLAVLAERFASPEVNVVGGGVEFSRRGYWALADNLSMFYEYLAELPPGERRQIPSLNLAIRRSVFEQVGGFDERYPRPSGEDADLTVRLRRLGHRLYFEPQAVVFHAPPRHRLSDLLRHGYYQGMYSTKVDRRYAAEEGLPGLLGSRVGLVLAAPLLAGAVVARMFLRFPALRPFVHTAPAIYLAKLAWCLGAARHPD